MSQDETIVGCAIPFIVGVEDFPKTKAALLLYLKTYAKTNWHPSPSEEVEVMRLVREALSEEFSVDTP